MCHNQECGRREQLDESDPRMKRCLKCKEAYYCNPECQKLDWPAHKGRCKLLKEAKEKRSTIKEGDLS